MSADPTSAELLDLPTAELSRRARAVRAGATGTRMTYSPKVFIPLTRLCRDRCGYCTFATAPRHLDQPYLSIEEVLAIAAAGAAAGCHEALFTLGELPEERYPVAREW
ncbi:MAG: 7,8-didemethyl-8-hydroxy-5-deazariboflavin synthase, partial [Phycicoccus sp.]